jgi:antitoxin (DNA-binding transcriptional repressor) of toxin-antitoxin stability system
MIKVAVSEFKAKLASYLRLIKTGEQVEIQDRGITVALLSGTPREEERLVIPAAKDPKRLALFKAKITVDGVDPVQLLMEDRKRR